MSVPARHHPCAHALLHVRYDPVLVLFAVPVWPCGNFVWCGGVGAAGGSFYVIMEGAVEVYHKPMVTVPLTPPESTDG